MAKKMFEYRETITFVVQIAAEDREEAFNAGADFVEGILDHTEPESRKIREIRGYELEPMGGGEVEEQ